MKIEHPEAISKNLVRLRHLHRWSQRDLANKLHVHQTMVARWESGQTIPRPDTIEKLANVFEISARELLNPALVGSSESTSTDPELARLVGMIETFEPRDREALKTFLEAIVMKNQIRAAVRAAS